MLTINPLKPKDFINPLLAKKPILDANFERFKKELEKLTKVNQNESEEYQKNVICAFLQKSFDYAINTKDRIDFAIYEDSEVEVIGEVKSLTNKNEMITKSDLNKKAFLEAVLYFFEQRQHGGENIKHIVINTALEWFIFDAKDFDKLFWRNKTFKKIYKNFKNPSILGNQTQDFYDTVSNELNSYMENLIDNKMLDCAYFNLRQTQSQRDLKHIYKLLCPDSLLKKFNPNDANSLNKNFYNELLYILGLEEITQKGKKLIVRTRKPQSGSFYENITNKLNQYKKPTDMEIVLRLLIIWINRILFLKLLESQISTWHEDENRKFLNIKTIKDFDMLESLFFDILSRTQDKRRHKEFSFIPYLNSSLFEFSNHEDEFLTISQLSDDVFMDYYPKTVIKDENMHKKEGKINTLAYLFEFLDAYDFSSQKGDEIVKEEKALINPSVLGLIFEKINGYKDGSFYTPSFITMHICKETIENTVLEKFSKIYNMEVKTIEELKRKLNNRDIPLEDIEQVLDSVTILDPAVGSGHFLVSALNELIFIRNRLVTIQNTTRKNIFHLQNDELIIEDFLYTKNDQNPLQKTLFDLKRHIIENQLFGVDINPNSVAITKLRLWIELLKNSYFKEDGTLETLPNIDINIKTGNSLVSRFSTDDSLNISNIKEKIKIYKQKTNDYKDGIGTKDEVLASIKTLKNTFLQNLHKKHKITIKRDETLREYQKDFGLDGLGDDLLLIGIKNRFTRSVTMFDEDKAKKWRLLSKLNTLHERSEYLINGKIYENAIEWRYEFPEVLDENGDFIGFDIVIGNPPYIMEYDNKEAFDGARELGCYQGKADIWHLFTDIGLHVLKPRGYISFIAKNQWMESQSASNMRKKIYQTSQIKSIVDFGANMIFDEASVQTMIFLLQKNLENSSHDIAYKKFITHKNNDFISENIANINESNDIKITQKPIPKLYNENANLTFSSTKHEMILENIESMKNFEFDPKKEIIQGIIGGPDSAFIISSNELENFTDEEKTYIKMFHTNTQSYHTNKSNSYIFYICKKNFKGKNIDDFANIKEFFQPNKNMLEDAKNRYKTPNKEYFYLHRERDESFFKQGDKIVWAKRTQGKKFTFTKEPFYGTANLFFIKSTRVNLAFVTALLNSNILYFYMQERLKHTGDLLQLDKNQFLKIPIFIPKKQKPIINLVNKIIEEKKLSHDTSSLENEINILFYHLYGFNDEDIKTIEESIHDKE